MRYSEELIVDLTSPELSKLSRAEKKPCRLVNSECLCEVNIGWTVWGRIVFAGFVNLWED